MPAAHGLAAHAKGDHADAARLLGQAMPHLQPIGGSIAQRALFGAIHLDALMRSGWNDAALAILQADDRERPTVPSTKRALAGLYRQLGRTEQALAAEYQAEQLARQYKAAKGESGMTDDLTQASAARLSKLYRQGKASPVETMKAVLARAEKINPLINALTRVDAGAALKAARASERRWKKGKPLSPIDGVPVSIKELVRVKGWPASMGSKLTDKTPADADAPAVARLREAGAIVFAQSTSSEFGHKGVTDSPLHGISRNPWNLERTPGGSSGGAGAAVAAGLGPLAIGTDGGGSVRIPSSFNGLVGLKATYGRVPAWPPSLNGDLANTGPMCRTALDCALMMNVIARPDPRDPYHLPPDDTDYAKKLGGKLKKLRVAFMLRMGEHPLDIEVAALVTKAARQFEKLGCTVEEASPPFPYADASRIVRHALADQRPAPAAALSRGTPRRVRSQPAGLGQGGPRYSLQDVVNAQAVRRELAVAWNLFFAKYDLLLTPDRRGAALRGRQEPAGRPRRQAQPAMVALHLAVQPDAPSRRLGAVRPQPRGPADRPADRVGPLQGRARAARRGALCRGPSAEISRPSGDQEMTADLAMMPAHELVKLYKARKASPVEATKAALTRIEAFNPQLNAFQHLDPDGALRAARASEKRWKKGGKRLSDIDGVPITIKDMVLTKGMPTRMGSLATDADGPWTVDAPVAQRLREAGTVLLGKTTSPEYGWKGVTDSALFGATHNPWKIGRTPGGSSGGGVAAEAVGMGNLAVGTDGAGSVRIPCSFTGLFGLKPTQGRVPLYPPSAQGTLAYRADDPHGARCGDDDERHGAPRPARPLRPARRRRGLSEGLRQGREGVCASPTRPTWASSSGRRSTATWRSPSRTP